MGYFSGCLRHRNPDMACYFRKEGKKMPHVSQITLPSLGRTHEVSYLCFACPMRDGQRQKF